MRPKTLLFLLIVILVGLTTVAQTRNATLLESFLELRETAKRGRTVPETGNDTEPEAMVPYKPVLEYENAIISAVENATPSVVSIVVTKDLPILQNCYFSFTGGSGFQRVCEIGTEKREIGGGTGFIISADGMIVTNKHVVIDTDADYTVLTNDGEEFDAHVLARDPIRDIAVIQIQATGLKPATLGDSDAIKLGQTAIAIGNALGEFRNTVSVGVISGLSRDITAGGAGFVERIEGVIQTDTAINPGNSGGPLLNLRGEVVGMNTAVAAGAEGIGFAIPINEVKRDIRAVQKTGTIAVPFLGIRYHSITPEFARAQGIELEGGALIRGTGDGPGVIPDSPAARAGLREEDIITQTDGRDITPETPLEKIIQKKVVGETITLTVLRGTITLTFHVVLGSS